MRFDELGLSAEMMQALQELHYETPTPIQAATIPPALEGRDIVGSAQTGTGKTAAFGIPMIERLRGGRHFRGLVLSPTRELAVQIGEHLEALARGSGLSIVTVYGGIPVKSHILLVRRSPDIIVATPGRLLDLIRHRSLRLEGVEVFVLDEADRMLDMGFADELNQIFKCLLPERQTMLFSATMPAAVHDIVRTGVRDPVRVEIAPHLVPLEQIEQQVHYATEEEKYALLRDLLKKEEGSVLVFVSTKRKTEELAQRLFRDRYNAARIHGDMSQLDRNRTLSRFRQGSVRVLVATDVMSRGIDVDDVAHVVNFDLPREAEDHIHRIGRTARAGATGKATTLVTPKERRALHHHMAQALGLVRSEKTPDRKSPAPEQKRRPRRRRRPRSKSRPGGHKAASATA